MNNLIKKLFDIREGEGTRAVMMFSYIFLVIASLMIVKPVRNSLFLTEFGPEQLPYAFVLVALTAGAFIFIYTRFEKKARLNLLIAGTTIASIT
ncbi:MAG: hypothetical protein GF307_03855, partial [candidate division Zixibacteria bacterium]|nr:hypothetical protein [candidate division Zixibacteria bacterium]